MATIVASAVETGRRPTVRLLAVLATAVVGAVATAITVWSGARSPVLSEPGTTSVFRGLFVASYFGVGAYTWWRRPGSRLGPLIVGAGFVYALSALNASGDAVPFTVGRVLTAMIIVYLVYLFLCFPRDRLGSRAERRLVLAFAVASAVVWALALALTEELPAGGPYSGCGTDCPPNGLQLITTPDAVARGIGVALGAVTLCAMTGLVILLVRKMRSPAVAPLTYATILVCVSYVLYILDAELGRYSEVMKAVNGVANLAIPFALLAGQVRGRIFAATSLGQLASDAGREPVTPLRVQTLLRDALGDPTLMLALWAPGRDGYVDIDGAPLEVPDERAIIPVVRGDRPVAALVYDPSFDQTPEVMEGLAATAAMLLENTRLVDELRASQSRIVATAHRERLRLERDLHDGAQQRLMAIQIKVAIAQGRTGDPGVGAELDEIARDAAAAVDELRELAHGIYPTVLRERGLGDALRSLANATPLPVRVVDGRIGRCSPSVETAIYYCSLEAIQNATKHAGAGTQVTVTLERRGDELDFSIADDGAGFQPGEGSPGFGLVNMRDRIGAVGGELEIVSSRGRGTIVRGTVPAAAPGLGEPGEWEM